MEVTERFKGLDLIECLKNYGQRFVTLYRRQGSRPSPRKQKCKQAKWLFEEALQIAEKRREVKGKGEWERYIQLNVEFQKSISFIDYDKAFDCVDHYKLENS